MDAHRLYAIVIAALLVASACLGTTSAQARTRIYIGTPMSSSKPASLITAPIIRASWSKPTAQEIRAITDTTSMPPSPITTATGITAVTTTGTIIVTATGTELRIPRD